MQQLKNLYKLLADRSGDKVEMKTIKKFFQQKGISLEDPRIRDLSKKQFNDQDQNGAAFNQDEFVKRFEGSDSEFIQKVSKNSLVIPDFESFTKDITEIFDATKQNLGGNPHESLPHPNTGEEPAFAVSICTVDGQILQLGDHELLFSIQSICKSVNYAIASEEIGRSTLHKYVGIEPGGEDFDTGHVLNDENLPHNPLINSGSIITSALIKPEKTIEERLAYVKEVWNNITGEKSVSYDEEAFESEWKNRSKNMALAHLMNDRGTLPEGFKIEEAVKFYLQCCSLEVSIDALAHASATMANYGFCPTTGKKIFNHDTVRDTLSIMLSSGTYDHSGEFTFRVGLPAKSGIAGGLMVVVPQVMGIAIYSPPLGKNGNSVRAVEFCERLVDKFNLHQLDSMKQELHGKKDPRKAS